MSSRIKRSGFNLLTAALIPLLIPGCTTLDPASTQAPDKPFLYPSPTEPPLIIGHRGSGLPRTTGKGVIGNTPNAIRAGIDASADWIEIDVRQSADGVLTVFHDPTLDRATNGRGPLAQKSWPDLRSLSVSVDPAEHIPSLDEIFQTFHSREHLWAIDIKQPGLAPQLIESLHHHNLPPSRVILFGTYDIISEYKNSGYPLAYVAAWSEGQNKFRILLGHTFLIDRCLSLGEPLHYLVVPNIFLTKSLVTDATNAKPELQVWTYGVESPADWHRSHSLGATGLIVDRVAEASQAFKQP